MFRSRVVAGVLLALLLAALCGCAASSAGEGASADVSGEGNGLVGLRVAIDAGHGGIDQGAVGAAGSRKDDQ